MSQFNEFAREINQIASEAFEEYNDAAARETRADEQRRQYPRPGSGFESADMVAKRATAEAAYLTAVQNREAVRRKMDEGEYRQRINATRKKLAMAVTEAFRADPAQIDPAALELLRSGICNADEYGAMLDKAEKSGNATMCRLIGKFASDAADKATEATGGYASDPEAAALRAVSYRSENYNGGQWLRAFDFLTDVFDRTCANPAMIDDWSELTAETVENF